MSAIERVDKHDYPCQSPARPGSHGGHSFDGNAGPCLTATAMKVPDYRIVRNRAHARLVRAVMSGVGIALVGLLAGGCAAAKPPIKEPRIPPLQTPAPTAIPMGAGAVVGGIDFCGGVFPKAYPRFVAGTVKAYRGELTVKQESPPGSFEYVFPGSPIAQERVKVNEEFRFFLPPGQYVLDVPAPWSPVGVTVQAGVVSTKDISGTCL